MFVVGVGGGEANRFSVDGDTQVGEDEVAVAGGARAVLGEGLIGEDAKAEGGEGLEAGRDGEVVGFLGLGGLVDEEGIVIEEFQGGAGSGAMLFEVNREPLGGLV